MKKKSLFVLMAAAVLASCSKSELTENVPVGGDQEIALRSAILSNVNTRSPFEGGLSAANPLTALVLGTETSGSYATIYSNGTMTFAGSTDGVAYTTVNDGKSTFPTGGTVHLSGLYPSTWGANGWRVAAGKATMTLTGKEDVMYAPEVTTSKADVRELKFATLAFEHKLTKLDLAFRATANNIYKVTGLKLSKVNGADIQPEVNIDLGTGVLSYSGTGADGFGCYTMAVDANKVVSYNDAPFSNYAVTTDALYQAYVLAPHVVATAANDAEYTFVLSYTENDAPKTSTVKVDLKEKLLSGQSAANSFVGSTSGFAFKVQFSFNSNDINATATVKDWNEGGETIVDVEEDAQ